MTVSGWEELTPSARITLERVVKLLGGQFTGEIHLRCSSGGILDITESSRLSAKDLEQR